MTTIELARCVREMRQAQKAYFKERTLESLDESKLLERQVDKTVKEILEDKPALLPFGD